MAEWETKRLDEVVHFQRGHDLTIANIKSGPYPVGGSNGVIGYHDNFTTKGPGLTIGRSGNSIGVVHYYKNDFWAHNTTLYSTKFFGSDPKYLYYFLRTIDFAALNSGSAVPSLNRNHIHAIQFKLPSLREQQVIAGTLSSLDDKIDLLHQQNKTLEAIAETLFRQWFVEEASDDWEMTSFADHFGALRGLSYRGSGLTERGLGTPMHNLNSVYEGGGYKESGIKYYSGEFKDRHLVCPGDVIVANTEQGHEFRLIGFPAIVPSYFGDSGIFSQHIYRLVRKESSFLTNEFIYFQIKTSDVREQITSATNGSTVNMLAIDGLQRPTFRLPPKYRVVEFSVIARRCRLKTDLNKRSIRQLETLRDTLLPKLTSGEVRVAHE